MMILLRIQTGKQAETQIFFFVTPCRSESDTILQASGSIPLLPFNNDGRYWKGPHVASLAPKGSRTGDLLVRTGITAASEVSKRR